MANPRVGQTGLVFELTTIEEDENGNQTPLDPTSATTRQIEFFGPQGINFKKDATAFTSTTITFTDSNSSSILEKAGTWYFAHYIVKSDGKISPGAPIPFEVDP